MIITEQDFILKPSSSVDKYDLTFMKRVKKRDTGKIEIEPGDTLYGLTFPSALRKIAHKRVAKKYAEENITLRQFLKEFQASWQAVVDLCHEQ